MLGGAPPSGSGSDGSPLLEVERVILQVPLWGIFFRPIPVVATFQGPSLHLDTGNIDPVGDLILKRLGLSPLGKKEAPLTRDSPGLAAGAARNLKEETAQRSRPPVALVDLTIREGQVEVIDRKVRPDQPVITAAHLTLKGGLLQLLGSPIIQVQVDSRLVKPAGEPVGFVTIESRVEPAFNRFEGRLQFWHDDLSELRRLYYYAPQPFFFEAGKGGPIVEWKVSGNECWASIRCLAEGLKVEGMVGQVPWNSILEALEDAQGKIDVAVEARGRLDDPHFDLHNRILSELDWAVKERCAARGLAVPTRIFFGLERATEGVHSSEVSTAP